MLNFNGTAGVWRRTCMEEAGGWEGDTLTEDLDLSYRAQIRGWCIAYLPDVIVPAEIPVSVDAFKRQQFRWAKGSMQTAKKLFTAVSRIAKCLPVSGRGACENAPVAQGARHRASDQLRGSPADDSQPALPAADDVLIEPGSQSCLVLFAHSNRPAADVLDGHAQPGDTCEATDTSAHGAAGAGHRPVGQQQPRGLRGAPGRAQRLQTHAEVRRHPRRQRLANQRLRPPQRSHSLGRARSRPVCDFAAGVLPP